MKKVAFVLAMLGAAASPAFASHKRIKRPARRMSCGFASKIFPIMAASWPVFSKAGCN